MNEIYKYRLSEAWIKLFPCITNTPFHGTAIRQNGNCTFWGKRMWVIILTVQPVSEFMGQITWQMRLCGESYNQKLHFTSPRYAVNLHYVIFCTSE